MSSSVLKTHPFWRCSAGSSTLLLSRLFVLVRCCIIGFEYYVWNIQKLWYCLRKTAVCWGLDQAVRVAFRRRDCCYYAQKQQHTAESSLLICTTVVLQSRRKDQSGGRGVVCPTCRPLCISCMPCIFERRVLTPCFMAHAFWTSSGCGKRWVHIDIGPWGYTWIGSYLRSSYTLRTADHVPADSR